MDEPKKSPSRRKKTTSITDNNIENHDTNVDPLIEAALQTHLLDYAKEKKKKATDSNHISKNTQEYLKNFILLGYDYKGKPLTIVHAENQRDSDSLHTLIQKFMFQTFSTGDPENPFIR
jgi:hypothetical protein